MFDPPPIIGRCIYCFSDQGKLQDEHVIPYGLNGTWELVDASCGDCADITSKFERDVLRKAFLAPRAVLGFRSYRKSRMPTHLPLMLDRGNGSETLQVPADDHPGIAVLPKFPPPAWLNNRSTKRGIDLIGGDPVHFGAIDPLSLVKKYRGSKLTVEVGYEPTSFARMVAKIAYGYAVAAFGLPAVRNSYLLPSILGTADDIGTWVGSTEGYMAELNPKPEGRVTHMVRTDTLNGDIVAYVRLFAWAVPSEYLVVIAPVPQ